MSERFQKRHYAFIGALLFGLVLLWWLDTFLSARFSSNQLRAYVSSFGSLAPLAYIGLLTLTIIIPPLPDVVVVIAGGLSFGVLYGTIYTLIAGLIGAAINFCLARRLGRPWLYRWLGERTMTRVDELAARTGWRAVFLMRLSPGFNFDLVSYAAGLTSMSFQSFLAATLFGMSVPVTLTVVAGSKAIDRPDLAVIVVAISIIGWAIVPILLLWFRNIWKRQSQS